MERFNLRNISELQVRKQHLIMISSRFAALENLNDNKNKSGAWKNIKGNIKISSKESLIVYELAQYKSRFDEECSQFCIKGS